MIRLALRYENNPKELVIFIRFLNWYFKPKKFIRYDWNLYNIGLQ